MSQIQAILDDPLLMIVSFFAIIYAIKEFDALVKWFKEKLQGYRSGENKKENLESTVQHISCVSENHTETLANLTNAIKDINLSVVQMNQVIDKRFGDVEEQRKVNQVITDRATLYQLYSDLHDKECLSQAEYEVFSNVAERYLSNDGNGVYRHKIVPFILGKPVSDD